MRDSPASGEFILAVWREACRHMAIAEFASVLAEMLAAKLPLARLAIRLITPAAMHVDTVAEVSASEPATANETATHETSVARWEEEKLRKLVRWCRRGELGRKVGDDPSQHISFAAIPSSWPGETILGPLVSEHGTLGLVLIEIAHASRFTKAHEKLVQMLLEPLAVALENDQRLRELNALREAAESEKRSLLTRLGREDMSEAIIGMSGGLRTVMERVELVARSDVPVLLFGETGSGKEVVARAIHNRSLASKGPFIRVNCGAIPPELIDSELFGHEKGSFTGAGGVRRGWFERADEGTLFLDEMGDLPAAAQVRLLRVLQDGEFNRVGGEEPVRVQVRIVAATHRDLAAMVQAGTFREDLWYRLAVFPIVLPPLRERAEDIPALAEHFAQRAAKRFGLKPQSPSAADLAMLKAYPWPGNVRELISVIDRATILGDGLRLEVSAALGGGQIRAAPTAPSAPSSTALPARATQILSLDAAAKQHIELALTATGGRVEGLRGAAALLQINPHTLRARMRKLGVDWASFRAALPQDDPRA